MAFCSSGSIFDDDKLIQIQFSLARNDTGRCSGRRRRRWKGKASLLLRNIPKSAFWKLFNHLACNIVSVLPTYETLLKEKQNSF